MPRETVQDKAWRLLREQRVRFTPPLQQQHVTAQVRGDEGEYEVHQRRGHWTCDCANPRKCSHILAVQAVHRIVVAAVPETPAEKREQHVF